MLLVKRAGKRGRELEKYGERKGLPNKHHKLANRIVELAGKHGIALEDLTENG